MAGFGYFVIHLFLIYAILCALLNLGGCGDRIGPKYRVSNWCQVVIPILIMIGMQVFK